MLSIGELAAQTRASVRMLRHYDALGLVKPVQIDPHTGYRWYAASQVGRVNALMALKALGFSLAQCHDILSEDLSAIQLLELLQDRRDELAERIADDTQRLEEVDQRRDSLMKGLLMSNTTFTIKPLPALQLAQVSTVVNDTSEISHVVGGLFTTLQERLTSAGVAIEGPGLRTYYGRPHGAEIEVAAAMSIDEEIVGAVEGVEFVLLDHEERGASVRYAGPATHIADAWFTIDVALDHRGLKANGVHRQVYLEAPNEAGECVVELQCPVRDAQDCPLSTSRKFLLESRLPRSYRGSWGFPGQTHPSACPSCHRQLRAMRVSPFGASPPFYTAFLCD